MRTAILPIIALLFVACLDSDEVLPPDVETLDPVPADCEAGDLGCPCEVTGSCAPGLTCGDEGLCELCQPGAHGCECEVTGLCESGLMCSGGTCVDEN